MTTSPFLRRVHSNPSGMTRDSTCALAVRYGRVITDTEFQPAELVQATRNHGMPLEALRYDVTPTGLHYLLIHYDIPALDLDTWRLEIGGLVGNPRSVTLADLHERETVEREVVMECAGNGRATMSPRPLSQPWGLEAVGCGRWAGTPLAPLLEEAGVDPTAVEVVFTGADQGIEDGQQQTYARSLSVADATADDVLLAHTLNGQPLPPQHGAPVRLLVPGWYGMTSVKWLRQIAVVDTPFTGYQQTQAYRFATDPDDPGTPLNRIAVRSLMIPPGIPDFPHRTRTLQAGKCSLEGRAWSGAGPIDRVEVSTDGGASWSDARLRRPKDPRAWTHWTTRWDATPGAQVLMSRATDTSGQTQPEQSTWNRGGYRANGWQHVPVTVV